MKLTLRIPLLFTLLLVGATAVAQPVLKVYDETGDPLIGALVTTPSRNVLLLTDAVGTVRLAGWNRQDSLLISSLGYRALRLAPAALVAADFQITLHPSVNLLTEVSVVGRRREAPAEVMAHVQQLAAADINLYQSSTTVDALTNEGLFVQKSQLGGGSPILRGFEANRVLLVVDGVRLNNAIYRSGHLQNAISVDESTLDGIDVIFGPGSLTYGSDALGGVIHFRTRQPDYLPAGTDRSSRWNTHYLARYATAADERTAHLRLEGRGQQWTSLTSVSFSHFGDLRAGDRYPNGEPRYWDRTEYVLTNSGVDQVIANPDPTTQRFSGYRQVDALQKLSWQVSSRWELTANLQLSTTDDVPRYDQLAARRNGTLRFAEWYYGPQTRTLAALRADARLATPWADRLSLIGSVQTIAEDRHDRRLGQPVGESSLVDVTVYQLTADLEKTLDRHQLLYGADLNYNRVAAEAYLRDFRTGMRTGAANSRYPSRGSSMAGAGAYAQYRWQPRSIPIRTELGLRYDYRQLRATFGENDPIVWPADFLRGIAGDNGAVTGSLGIDWRPDRWHWRAVAATAFRAPNLDDFAKFRENAGRVQIPNPDLRPEYSRTVESSLAYHWPTGGQVAVTGFYTRLRQAMVRTNAPLPSGESFFISRGDTLITQTIVNAQRGRLWGASVQATLPLYDHWQLRGGITYTRGQRLLTTPAGVPLWVPLDHIPPLYGRAALRYAHGRWEAKALVLWQAAKPVTTYGVTDITTTSDGWIFDSTGSSDNIEDARIDPVTGAFKGLYGWQTYNFYLRYRLDDHLQIQLALENVLDTHYRTFSSGISAPGRNLILAVRGHF